MAEDDPVSGDDLSRPDPGTGERRVFVRSRSTADRLVDLAKSYRIVVLGLIGLVAVVVYRSGLPEIPPQLETFAIYSLVGALGAVPAGRYLVNKFSEPRGIELLDLDPVTEDHRHLRVGTDLWEDIEVRTPWGGETGTDELKRVSVNGRMGYEVMDFRVDDGTPVAVSTWLGSADSATLRTYKYAVKYARRQLAERADKATALRANQQQVVREAAERVVRDMIRVSERSGVPSGDEIDAAVSETLDAVGFDDPLDDDRDPEGSDPDLDPTGLDDVEVVGDLDKAGIKSNGSDK